MIVDCWVGLGVCGCDVIRWAGWVMESWAEPWSLGVRRGGSHRGEAVGLEP